jgi:predicted GNAT family acetyltransferase
MLSFSICHRGRGTYVAVGPDGTVLGSAELAHTLHDLPVQNGRRFLELTVPPQARGQGIGGALYAAAENSARRMWVHTLACAVAPDDPAALAFATRRGFTVEHRMMDGELDLRSFNLAPWAGAVAAAESRGIRFTTLLQAQDDPRILKNLYALDGHCSQDVPCQNPPRQVHRPGAKAADHLVGAGPGAHPHLPRQGSARSGEEDTPSWRMIGKAN